MKQLFQKNNNTRMLEFFFNNPGEAYLREIARKTKMSPPTASRCIRELEDDDFVERRDERHATYFKAVRNPAFKALKTAYTVLNLEKSGAVKRMIEKSHGLSSILLYGSAAKGEDTPESDLDFLVICAKCGITGTEIGELMKRECSVKCMTATEWKKTAKDNRAFYLEAISNSIALFGEKPIID